MNRNIPAQQMRVAHRWLTASLLKGPEYLRLFETARTDIERRIRTEDLDGAMDVFETLMRQFRPVWETASSMVVRREDERRKFESFMTKIKPLRFMTRPGYIREDVESAIDAEVRLTVSLDRLDETVKFLSRNMNRLVGYETIEKTFKHGPFTIINHYGYRPDEIQIPLKLLDDVSALIQRAGFGNILYGNVRLAGKADVYTNDKTTVAGRYFAKDDHVDLYMNSTRTLGDIHVLTHELGHRHWFKSLSESDRETYTDAYNNTAPHLTVSDRELLFDALVQSDFGVAKAMRLLPEHLAPLAKDYLSEKMNGFTQTALRNNYAREPNNVRSWIVVPRTKAYFVGETRPTSVTEYGRTHVKEDYAEVFSQAVRGVLKPGPARDRFVNVTGWRG